MEQFRCPGGRVAGLGGEEGRVRDSEDRGTDGLLYDWLEMG